MSAPRPFIVKICGITTPDDAAMVVAAGADAVGVNLWPRSKRYVDDAAARAVLAALPAGVLKVGVFVNTPVAEVAQRITSLGLDRAQLHGDERPDDFAELDGARLVRAVRVRDDASFGETAAWKAGLFLFDAFVDGYGGAGVAAPWPLVARHARRPFLLAGGLTPDNVAAAIAATRPDGVDVASGVERAPGRKDRDLVTRFIDAARTAARKL
jgi:phosphoribosylanthranilate isomerase